uniref:Transcription factor SPT20 homolog n=1 Tax=Phallusia mammillata TaxID=59560 RepID=A0A6F9DU89_9ASCI|nr:transcription factor SPT20 homolog [Phallusia mammillata]
MAVPVLQNHYSSAEFLMQSAEKRLKLVQKDTTSTKWRSLYSQLAEVEAEERNETSDDEHEPFSKHFHMYTNPLHQLYKKNKDLSRLIVNLFPLENGYSLMFKTATGHCTESKPLPYEEYEILEHIDNGEIPPMLIETFENFHGGMFTSGCIVAEIRDYRIAAGPEFFDTKYVLLRPTQQTLLGDVNSIVNETSHQYQWTNEDRLALESFLILSTSDPLCLDPSPTVAVIKNIAEQQNKTFRTHPMRRCIRRNGMNAMRRRKEQRSRAAPPALKLFDFLQRRKEKSEKTSSSNDIRLPKNITDLWHKNPVDSSLPTSGLGIKNCVKMLNRQPQSISDTDMLEVQHIHLKSEGQNREVYSLITILQRPSDMQYFGKLQSNKYFQQAVETTGGISSSCRFPLGTEHRANLYILQYQELFAEDGRRPATVTVTRPLQPTTKYQIPLLQQPWQLEQDKSLYAVGSVNNIPIKHWPELRVSDTVVPKPQGPPPRPPQTPRPQPPSSTSNNTTTVQLSSVTTPTLNTVTLQPGTQSAFMFPIPRTQQQQQAGSNQLATSQSTTSAPTLARLLGPRLSTETLNLITGDGSLYQLKETSSENSGRLLSGSHDTFTIVSSQAGGHEAGGNLGNMTGVGTSLLHDDHNQNNNAQNIDMSGPVNLQLPLTMTIASQAQPQQQQQVAGQQPIQLQAKIQMATGNQQHISIQPHQAAPNTVIRLPASIATASGTVSAPSGSQQMATTINLVGGGRNVLSTPVQQIQLQPGSRPGTVTIPANLAMQLAAQLNQDKGGAGNSHQISLGGPNTSSPITIVTNDNNAGAAQSTQQQHQFRSIVTSHSGAQLLQQVEGGGSGNKSTTITINPRTQLVNLRTSAVQQPVQILQVGAQGNIQSISVRNQGKPQQIVLNAVRSATPDHNNPQLTLTQQLQQLTSSVANSNGKQGRARKRKITPDKKT